MVTRAEQSQKASIPMPLIQGGSRMVVSEKHSENARCGVWDGGEGGRKVDPGQGRAELEGATTENREGGRKLDPVGEGVFIDTREGAREVDGDQGIAFIE